MRRQLMKLVAILVLASPLVVDAENGGAKSLSDCCMPWESTSEQNEQCCEVTCQQYCDQQTSIPIYADARCGGPPAHCSGCTCECLSGGPVNDIPTHEDDPECATCEFEGGPYFCWGD
jgi:hypothetical protein